MDSGERGMNPVAMTIISSTRNVGKARDRTSDILFSCPARYRQSCGARLPEDKRVDLFKFKHLQTKCQSLAEIIISVYDRTGNIVGKGESAGYQHVLLFQQCVQKAPLEKSR